MRMAAESDFREAIAPSALMPEKKESGIWARDWKFAASIATNARLSVPTRALDVCATGVTRVTPATRSWEAKVAGCGVRALAVTRRSEPMTKRASACFSAWYVATKIARLEPNATARLIAMTPEAMDPDLRFKLRVRVPAVTPPNAPVRRSGARPAG